VRGIVLSRVYGLDHDPTVDPTAFAAAVERPIDAESLARSWAVVAGRPADDGALRRAAVAAIPDVAPRVYHATLQQARFLSAAPALAGLLEPVPGSTVAAILEVPNAPARVEAAFRAAYARSPDAEESARAVEFLAGRADDPPGAVRDLLWALLTSAEFLTMP
jgi:hypothetical protein